jgi:hypothetical protein
MKRKFSDKYSNNLKPDEYFNSRIIEVTDLPSNRKEEIKSNVPIEVRVNGGEWVKIDPSKL